MWLIITWFGVGNKVGSQTSGVSLFNMTCNKWGGNTGGHGLWRPLEDTGGFGWGISWLNSSEEDLKPLKEKRKRTWKLFIIKRIKYWISFSSEILKTSSYLLMHFISTSRASNASRSVELTVIMLFFPPIPSSTEGKVGSNVQSPSTTNLYWWVPRGSSMMVTKQDEVNVLDKGISCQLLKSPLKLTCFGFFSSGLFVYIFPVSSHGSEQNPSFK